MQLGVTPLASTCMTVKILASWGCASNQNTVYIYLCVCVWLCVFVCLVALPFLSTSLLLPAEHKARANLTTKMNVLGQFDGLVTEVID
jgi:hypothetical protein